MKPLLKWLGIIFLILVGFVAVIAIIGFFLPTDHKVSRTIELKQPPEKVYEAIADFQNAPEWNSMVTEVKQLKDQSGNEVWQETYTGGEVMKFETIEAEKPKRLVRKIADVGGPFTGRWEFDIEKTDDGCKLKITEHGRISNPLVRFAFRYLSKPEGPMETYLNDLGKKFEETVEPQTAD